MIVRIMVAALLIVNCIVGSTHAQPTPTTTAADIKLQLEKLKTLGNVLYFAAHPDDENTRLIAYLAKEGKYRTGYLSLTRGDGGQNLIGNEQAELLGLIRTQELLAARRIDGGEQFFTRANDFGFCKNPTEAFTIWNKEQVLADAVWVIRNFKPDVIICRFPADSRAGHGHHTASAMVAAEAFEAAADPKRFPEQLKFVQPWQVKRLLWNTFNFGSNNTIEPGQFKLDIGAYNYLLGKGYGEIAAESRSQHKSQGFGVPASRGESFEYFSTIKGSEPKTSIMDGIATQMKDVPAAAATAKLIDEAIAQYNISHPSTIVPQLIKVRKSLQALPANQWKEQKLKEVDDLIIAAAGLWMEAYSNESIASPGQTINTKLEIINRSNVKVDLKEVALPGWTETPNKTLDNNKYLSIPKAFTLPANTAISEPYWLANNHPIGMYVVNNQDLIGRPENKAALTATFKLTIDGEPFTITRPVVYKYTDQVKGELYKPFVIAPPVVAGIDNSVFIFTSKQAQKIPVKITATTAAAEGTVSLTLPEGFTVAEKALPYSLKGKGDEVEVVFNVTPISTDKNATGEFTVVVNFNGKEYTENMQVINYDHIPTITLFPSAAGKLVTVNLKYNGKRIGYIPGAGDKVAETLTQIGYDVTRLSDKDIMNGSLDQYDAIITGVRAYNTQPRMKLWQDRLMQYVKNGGTMLVQYNVNQPLVTTNLGPFPFSLSRDRVTNEQAPVTLNDPANAVFNYPNKINAADFDGWIQERGLYYTVNVDGNYEKLFTMNDPGESNLDGATIVAKYGKGRYVYTSLAFFRQLPAGVPGAFRLFVNLISKEPNNIANGH
ncbi:LmbE family N-acetylglucosaminyl deacetylase [Chitinophaga skermanii]|uniref:LmbE family N-acetylglucosaminyl deacetylase n=1 Tax=Chitinophaga skermanii TaxID=331697 RepID=A0A327QS84_9BACT|nr:PIG-L family deacetylase [Chitinophaga skermanii]RAJ06755.1 LmbE family N-acetylglucosaminyl deacetylase [Chitinophaga skermanii]